MRGEHSNPSASTKMLIGPSPRARGTPGQEGAEIAARRSIPACAGNTPWSSSVSETLSGPSPRARGTHEPLHRSRPVRPVHPRVRGEHDIAHHEQPLTFPVHPRVRGEHRRRATGAYMSDGPSPRARGTPLHALKPGRVQRSIPACAGNTLRAHNRLRCFRGVRYRLEAPPRTGSHGGSTPPSGPLPVPAHPYR